jgi:hypothetical protein
MYICVSMGLCIMCVEKMVWLDLSLLQIHKSFQIHNKEAQTSVLDWY